MHTDILLATINAKWIHPSLALRLLKANLGHLEEHCTILEFALRQPLAEKAAPILAAQPRILGLSVSIWNHAATVELLNALELTWGGHAGNGDWGTGIRDQRLLFDRKASQDHDELTNKNPSPQSPVPTPHSRPLVVLGGPEVSHLPPDAEIFRFADFVVRGEGEHSFRKLCESVLCESAPYKCVLNKADTGGDFVLEQVDLNSIKSGYHLYSDEDLRKKLVYVESGRGCPFSCEFCLGPNKMRYFPLDSFLAEMGDLVERGARTFKFLDRAFNMDIDRARKIMEFFLDKIDERIALRRQPPVVHFEMFPSRFPPELRETLIHFPPGTLRLEIGIQTFNADVAARINRPSTPEKELEALRFLREKTNAIIHADLIAGLPGEGIVSFGDGFDRLWAALSPPQYAGPNAEQATHAGTTCTENQTGNPRAEIQLGILKLLPGASIARYSETFGMHYNPSPPYEVLETAGLPARDLDRIKNFARFWELIVNRGLINWRRSWPSAWPSAFWQFMALSDSLLERFGRNWGIAKTELRQAVQEAYTVINS
jgi:hypothetical protein